MSAAADIFIVDYMLRPFAKIFEKMPLLMLFLLLLLYGYIAYVVLKSTMRDTSY